jgi:hypothetical protein
MNDDNVSGKALAAGLPFHPKASHCSSHGQPTVHRSQAILVAGENGRKANNNHNRCWRTGVETE